MASDWQKKSPEEKARYVANAKAKRHAKALAEGREGRKYLQDIAVAHGAKRRARKAGNGGTHTAADIRALFFEQKGICAWCDTALDAKDYHVDHWKPLSKGGSNDKSNLKLLHPKCNMTKGAKLPSDFNFRSA